MSPPTVMIPDEKLMPLEQYSQIDCMQRGGGVLLPTPPGTLTFTEQLLEAESLLTAPMPRARNSMFPSSSTRPVPLQFPISVNRQCLANGRQSINMLHDG